MYIHSVNKALKHSNLSHAAQEGDSPRDSAEVAEISEKSQSALAHTNTDAIQYYDLQTLTPRLLLPGASDYLQILLSYVYMRYNFELFQISNSDEIIFFNCLMLVMQLLAIYDAFFLVKLTNLTGSQLPALTCYSMAIRGLCVTLTEKYLA